MSFSTPDPQQRAADQHRNAAAAAPRAPETPRTLTIMVVTVMGETQLRLGRRTRGSGELQSGS